MTRRLLTLPLALLLALAGCLQPADPAGVDADGLGDVAASLGPQASVHEGEVVFGFSTPARTLNLEPGDSAGSSFELARPDGQVTGYVIELEWSAQTPLTDSLALWVADSQTYPIPPGGPEDVPPVPGPPPLASARGTSPLRIELPIDALAEGVTYSAIVRADTEPAGVAVDQPFTLHIATFVDSAFDSSYSSLESGAGHDHV